MGGNAALRTFALSAMEPPSWSGLSRPSTFSHARGRMRCPGQAGPIKKRARSCRARSFRPLRILVYSYLNSGMAFSSSLVALNTAWSGYQGFDLVAAGGLAAEPVVVLEA